MQLGHFGTFRSIALFDVLLDEFDDDTPRSTEDDLDSFQKLPIEDEDSTTDVLPEDDGLAAEGEVQLESDEELLAAAEEEAETWSDDPVRMYLTQMGEIPLLTRDEEIRLAKAIEVTRRRFRTKLLECDYVMQFAYKILKRVHTGELPFDRTVQVSVTDRLEKDQILGRLPHNLKTLDVLLRRNARDYRIALSHSHGPERRKEAWDALARRRRKAVRLVEELGLRTQRLEPRIIDLAKFSRRIDELRAEIDRLEGDRASAAQRTELLREYRELLIATQETPSSLRNRVHARSATYSSNINAPRSNSPKVTCGWSCRSPRSIAIEG